PLEDTAGARGVDIDQDRSVGGGLVDEGQISHVVRALAGHLEDVGPAFGQCDEDLLTRCHLALGDGGAALCGLEHRHGARADRRPSRPTATPGPEPPARPAASARETRGTARSTAAGGATRPWSDRCRHGGRTAPPASSDASPAHRPTSPRPPPATARRPRSAPGTGPGAPPPDAGGRAARSS